MSRSIVRAFLVASALATLSSVASAEDLNTVLANYYKARGGLDKLKALTSVKMTGNLSMGEMQAPLTLTSARPNKLRMEFVAMGMTGMQGYDGTTAWMFMPFMGQKNAEPMPPDEAREIVEQADFDGPLVDWEAKGNKVELVGKEEADGTDAYKIKVIAKSGSVRMIYLDAEAYLELKEVATSTIRDKETTTTAAMSDYKEVNGVLFPYTMEMTHPGQPGSQKLVFDKIETNVNTDAVQFAMPAKVATGDGTPSAGGPAGDVVQGAGAKADSSAASAKVSTKSKKTSKQSKTVKTKS